MVSDTSFDQSELETSQNVQATEFSTNTINVCGTQMKLESGMWRIKDIRSKMTIESETTGGGGHITGMGGFVSGHIAPIKSRTTSYTTYTYFLENSDGHRMNFSLHRELDAIVGDNLFVVASERVKNPKRLFMPMVYNEAYNQWEIWKDHISGMISQSKHARIYNAITLVISLLFAAFCYIGVAFTGGQFAGLYILLVGPLTALLCFAITYALFLGIGWLSFLPARIKLAKTFKKMQNDLLP